VKFWDSSALVPLLIQEPTTAQGRHWMAADGELIVWWATELECLSAIHRSERDNRLTPTGVASAMQSLAELRQSWQEIEPTESVRQQARRLLRVHPLRAADAMQLAAAFIAANQQPATLGFVCLDDRLADAARREGFPVLGK
jgi:predicted nucleic acid-binding protein